MDFAQVNDIKETAIAASTNHLVDLPATVVDDELLLLSHTVYGGTTVSTPPAGWVEMYKNQGDSFVHANLYKRKGVSGDGGGTATFVMSASAAGTAQVYRIGSWGGNLANDVEFAEGNGTGTEPDPPNLILTWGADNNLIIVFCHSGDDDQVMSSAPANYTNLTDTACGAGGNASGRTASARREVTTAAENPGVFTLPSSESWDCGTVGVKPGSAGEGGGSPLLLLLNDGDLNGGLR